MIVPVIMAGGTGTRLWPLSRSLYPKQFLNLVGEQSMLQATLARLDDLPHAAPIIICNEDHRFIVAEQLRAAKLAAQIILEPAGRNTAPAIALAALAKQKEGLDPILLVLAADHLIGDVDSFLASVAIAEAAASAGKLATFGIVPNAPETGYGYIRKGAEGDSPGSYVVDAFVEKPDLQTAERYLAEQSYLWNSGMFMFKASTYLTALKQFTPDIYNACEQAMASTATDLDFIRIAEQPFLACPSDSIDYAVMEKTTEAVVVPMNAEWSDVGSWSALWDVDTKDGQGNAFKGDVILHDTHDCLVHGAGRLIATVGIDDLVIVDTKDALLVAHKSKVQDVKAIVDKLKAEGRTEFQQHREVYRPWGKYDSVDNGQRYQVKRITVKPGAKLSVQMHHHRAEHWIVVSGTAQVTNGDRTFLVTENESTYIPVGVVHALENPGKVPLELIEVQSGSYLGEDDIVRFEDKYGRA